jgi:mannose-6-phosphate isomerase-like protein (cupin superfamily)
MSDYKTNIVKKPWGYEYLAYENEHVALWFLHIKYTHSTSLHCHPNKTTGLVLLNGKAEVSFLNHSNPLSPGEKIMIRKGLFHSTKATDKKGAFIFEIETPVDKQDLVRFRDSYGREGKPYEDNTHEIPKIEDCLWIKEPSFNSEIRYNFIDCELIVKHISSVDDFNSIDNDLNVIFLKGGLQADYGQNVAGPGDVVAAGTIKQLIEVFNKIDSNTIIMIIKNNFNG